MCVYIYIYIYIHTYIVCYTALGVIMLYYVATLDLLLERVELHGERLLALLGRHYLSVY